MPNGYIDLDGSPSQSELSAAGKGIRYAQGIVHVMDYGATLDGVANDTPAFNAAAADLIAKFGGGVVLVPAGIPCLNLTINYPGVIFRGVGYGKNVGEGAPSTNYWKAFDGTKPVVLVGDDITKIEGSGVEYAEFYGAGTQQRGLVFGGGSIRCIARRVKITAFTDICLGYVAGSSQFSAQNVADDFYLKGSGVGSRSLAFIDLNASASSVFSNDHYLSNGRLNGINGATVIENDGSWAWLSNVKIDCIDGGIIFEQTGGRKSVLHCSNVEIDAAIPQVAVLAYARDAVTSTAGFDMPLLGGVELDGVMMASANKTTATVASGSSTMTVADATGYYAGRTVLVYAAGGQFSAKVKSVSGTTITLATNAPRAASGATAYVGDVVGPAEGYGSAGRSLQGAGLQLLDKLHSEYGFGSMQPYLFGAFGNGSVAPYNGYDLVWELASRGINFLTEVYSKMAVTGLSRTGSTVTLTAASIGRANVGDLVVVRGANEDGFVGTYAITGVTGTTVTYTSPLSSPDGSATGTIYVWVVRNLLKLVGRDIIASGLRTYTDDTAAAAGGVPVNGLYRNGSVVMVRVT